MSSPSIDRGPFRRSWTGLPTNSPTTTRWSPSDRRLTFAQLRDEVRTAAAAMIDLGVDAGDRVAIWSPNTWHWVVACLATHYAGGVVVPLNTRYTAGEAADILARTGAPLLIAAGEFLGADKTADLDRAALPDLRHIVRVPIDKDDGTWDEFVARGTDLDAVDARAAAVQPDDVSDILFTSGTTGRSKGVLCAHRQSLDAPAAWAACGQLTSADRYLCINPFFHNFGYKAGILACLQTGATLIPQLTFDPEKAMAAVAEHRITVLPGPPTIYQTLLDHPKRGDYDLSSLRFAVTGAATIPVVLIERMQSELDIDIVLTAYGLTEASGFGTMCRADDDAVTVATTCGRPIADFELRIDDPAEDGAGEVLLRGPNVMLGYLDDPEATADDHRRRRLAAHRRHRPRRRGRQPEDHRPAQGHVHLRRFQRLPRRDRAGARAAGRRGRGRRHRGARRAARRGRQGVRRASWQEPSSTRQAVIAYTREHLANFKTPRSVVFLDVLPRNPGGKVVKPQLREMSLMDLTFDERDRGVPGRGPRLPRRQQGALPDEVLRHRRGLRAASALGQGAVRRRPVGDRVAEEVRRPRRLAAAVDRLRGGVLPGRGARPGQRQRHLDAGSDAVRARHRRTARPGAAEDGQRRGDLGAGLVGAGVGQRPGVAAVHRDQDRRRLEAQRAEDLELAGAVRRQGIRAVPVRPRSASGTRA